MTRKVRIKKSEVFDYHDGGEVETKEVEKVQLLLNYGEGLIRDYKETVTTNASHSRVDEMSFVPRTPSRAPFS